VLIVISLNRFQLKTTLILERLTYYVPIITLPIMFEFSIMQKSSGCVRGEKEDLKRAFYKICCHFIKKGLQKI